ncbi:MAG: ribonuclease HIII [Candidatus Omnitrophica bacterium]|nr:ribonuclease HIII [Candidatus Omnitrophota bacterium]
MTYKIASAKEIEVRKELEKLGFAFSPAEYAFWRAVNKEAVLTFYKSGKLLIQGKQKEKLSNYLIDKGFVGVKRDLRFLERIGTDESGKGDYFGPLIIAGAMIKDRHENHLLKLGIKDSKKLSDKKINDLAGKIRELCPYSIVTISPPRYNQLLKRMNNLNRVLAWGHARAIENILEKENCEYVISDQFGDKSYILNALMKKGKSVKLEQRHYAEEDTAVAVASILARDEFVRKIEELSENYGINLPKGASDRVIEAGREFVAKHGRDKLGEVAKLHFKTSLKI